MKDTTAGDASSAEPQGPAPEARFPIVGIGGSAGGVEALHRLLPHIDPGCGMAFIVVLHLDPDHPSILPELLGRTSRLPVMQIQQGTPVEPGHVYVIPPNAALTIHAGRLMLAPRGSPNTIDEFFTALAVDQEENAACVVLSGAGTDGTIGLRGIKEHGGFALAQSDAEYASMMRSAVATGLVDFVLQAEEIPAKLVDYFGHITRVEQQKGREGAETDVAHQLSQITTLLRAQTGHDFSGYKDRTLIRRVQRRMHVLQIDDAASFIERLQQDPKEVALLFQDLLIGVTHFFRDAPAFATLEEAVIPHLFDGKGADATIRVWVPGCATGEEAYSIAMLLREHGPKSQRGPKLQLFATDIDDQALEIARSGRYPATIAKDVPAERLAKYFVKEDGTYRVAEQLREICLFSSHNLLRDPPFSRLDLISCRNLLIYFGSDLQERVIPLFHYALNNNGYLFLGTSENVTRHAQLFSTIHRGHRIFQHRPYRDRWVPQFPMSAPDPEWRGSPRLLHRDRTRDADLKHTAEQLVLRQFAPAYVIVNAEGDLVQASGRTGKYLELPSGAPDTNVFNMARPGLRMQLRAALHKAMGSGQRAVHQNINIDVNGGRQEIDLAVQSLRVEGTPEPFYAIVFQDHGTIKPTTDAERSPSEDDVTQANVRQLEVDLQSTREQLQTATEELESSNEELKSSNEELQSINEELQSTNEELETSKEELQSINEELQTVNAELSSRVDELTRANNDMHNLLESTQIAAVFLDRDLLVKRFTPTAKDVFRLIESDAGRPIMHVRSLVELNDLQADAERVLRTLHVIERPVNNTETGTRYMMRMLPYRTADNVISGIVLTFTDVTRMTTAEARIEQLARDLRARVDELEILLDLVPVGVMIAESSPRSPVLINRYGARLIGGAEDRGALMPQRRRSAYLRVNASSPPRISRCSVRSGPGRRC
jgi:two-component system CheB/CheR fusion protein